jgi:SAM-dependent methyltransferase
MSVSQISRLAARIKSNPEQYHRAKKLLRLVGIEWEHWSRVVMNRTLAEFVRQLDYARLQALEISGIHWRDFGFHSYQSIDFPQYDVCQGPLAEAAFDLVVAEQVFEHIRAPRRAAENVWKMLRPGGWFIVSTPFLYRYHPAPEDCSRWTESGLKYLLIEAGFQSADIRTGSWGNLACVKANLKRIPHWNRWFHSLRNEPEFPIMIWAMARKAATTS